MGVALRLRKIALNLPPGMGLPDPGNAGFRFYTLALAGVGQDRKLFSAGDQAIWGAGIQERKLPWSIPPRVGQKDFA
jgi:hypothetical protein